MMAMSIILDKEKMDLEDYFYRKSLQKVLNAFAIRQRQRAVTRSRMANS